MARQVLAGAGGLTGRVPRWLVTVLGAALVLLGLVLAVRPFRSLAALVILLVGGLLLSGLGELARGHRPWGPLHGLVQLLAALSLLLWPGLGLGVLTLVVAAALVVDGVLGMVEGLRSTGEDRWAAALTGLALTVVGILALAWRDVALLVVAVAFGLRLVLLGLHLVRGAKNTHRTHRSHRPGRPRPTSPHRRLTRAVLAVTGAMALAVVGVLVQLGHPRPDAFYSAPEEVPAQPGQLLAAEPFVTGVPDGASAWRILYTTTREDGIPAVASGLVVTGREQPGASPVIAWAHGTTGWAPGCAPSLLDEPFEAGALFVLEEMLERGWTVVATDYVGLGTEGPHPYVIGQGEGRSVLDSVRAAQQLEGPVLADTTVVWGHSQGGHAALWTGILAPDYAPELSIDGVAALAPASNLQALVQVIEQSPVGALFAVYVVQAYTSVYPEVRYEDYVRPGAQLLAREMAQRCLPDRGVLVSLGQSLLLDRPIWDRDPTTGPFGARLEQNVPTGRVEAPLLVAQGEADTLITPAAQEAYVTGRCAEGQEVDYRTYPGRDHLSLVAADSPAMEELLTWTTQRLAGSPAGDTCPG
ncbi:lipase family protein [Ornithinimicrobium sufpigmenti]|uniref:lipase family protein n=1 Tax=Ornithinimicrobium sufpigmenti TaxID=2508882 RepID=UPI0010357CA0|nr:MULTISPECIES: lipase family protein [unclassified Ornithinimicrobium]